MYLFITIFRNNLVVDISNRKFTFPYNANYYYYYIMYIYNLLKINKNVVTCKNCSWYWYMIFGLVIVL